MINIGIIHAKREVDSIGQTINNLNEEFPGIILNVFCEPGSEFFDGGYKVIKYVNGVQLGVFLNWLHALSCMQSRLFIKKWILICEDDIEWIKESGKYFISYLNEHQDDESIGFVSGYCSVVNANKEGFGLAKISPYGWCGALALAIPVRNVWSILNHPIIEKYKTSRDLDNLIGRILLDLGKKLIVHTPSLVNHLGAKHSTLLKPGSKSVYNEVRRTYDYTTHCLRCKLSKSD